MNTKTDIPNINLNNPALSFDRHFNNKDNKRIVFSGKFGAGKTYFLKEYFNVGDEINTFWLSPVKYAVSQNEDIFEYIKVDIAYNLLKNGLIKSVIEKNFGEDLYIDQFIKNKPLEIVKMLAYAMQSIMELPSIEAKVTASVGTAIEKLALSYETYKSFKKAINDKLKSDYDVLSDYLKATNEVKGSIFENDLITQTIQVALDLCRGKTYKENVLIIDDFDRLDPEHIFRILNILSVHNDHLETENKFGFDKIIIVCHIDNIKKIFAHRYGEKVDFDGYISKFFSLDIFHFDNSRAIQEFCTTELHGIIKDKDAEIVLGIVLSFFVEKGFLTIRNIMKYNFYKTTEDVELGTLQLAVSLEYKGKQFHYTNGRPFIENGINKFYTKSNDFPFLQAIRVLCIVFGDYKIMRSAFGDLEDITDKYYDKVNIPSVVRALVPLLNNAKHYVDPGKILFSYTVYSGGHDVAVWYPNYNIFGEQITINVGWTSDNKYSGDVSYYKHVNDNLKNDPSLANLNYKNAQSIKSLIKEIKVVFKLLEASKILPFWGMTT